MLQELKKMQMAAMMGASKPSVVLTDQTDLGDKMTELKTAIVDAVSKTPAYTRDQLVALGEVVKAVKAIETPDFDDSRIVAAVKAINLRPVVVPAPAVTLQERDVDLQPVIDAIRDRPADKLDLSCYRAQDLTNADDDTQYVGFVNPDGHWYIIENNVKDNTMRYVFGGSGYASHFKRASSLKYELLNEALSATS